jgi:hypothetical protein
MIDTRNSVTVNEEAQFQLPPPARFDDDASAKAQPVQPLPASRVALWTQRLRDAGQKLGGRTKAFALVMIGGLTIGAASGAMLATRHQASVSMQTMQQSIDETVGTEGLNQDTSPTRDMIGAEGSAMAMQRAVQPVRIRRHRSSLGAPGQRRAYRVAVLK